MQSSKPSKKSLKKEQEGLKEATPVIEAPKTRSTRSSKAAKESVDATPVKAHRKSSAAPSVRVEANDPGPAKVMTAAAGVGSTNGGIVDSVGVMAASPLTDAPIATPVSHSKPTVSPEEIAHLAYSYWEARGFSHGLADEDWIRAEAELLARR
ncbi:MAG: DUF2934 domain-containing protein [Bryobacteraceae bacterium]